MIPESNTRLHGRNALVTGASSGIGESIALALAAAGANVALVARRLGLLRKVAARCADRGAKALCYQADLLDEKQLRRLRRQVVRDFGGVDILVHSAGIIAMGRVAEASVRDFDRQYRCNVRAPFLLTQLLLATLVARKGQIVFINSTAGLQAPAGLSQYAATKHALKALGDSLRDEVNPAGVRVVSVYVGRTATPLQSKVHQWERRAYHPGQLIQPRQVADAVVAALAIDREGEITDLRIRPMRKPKADPRAH